MCAGQSSSWLWPLPGRSVLLTERSGFFLGLVLVSPSVSVFSRVLLRAFGSWLLVVFRPGVFTGMGALRLRSLSSRRREEVSRVRDRWRGPTEPLLEVLY